MKFLPGDIVSRQATQAGRANAIVHKDAGGSGLWLIPVSMSANGANSKRPFLVTRIGVHLLGRTMPEQQKRFDELKAKFEESKRGRDSDRIQVQAQIKSLKGKLENATKRKELLAKENRHLKTQANPQSIADPCPVSDFDRDNIDIALQGTWWSSGFFRLLAKSSGAHLERMRFAFPSHVAAYEAWKTKGGAG